LDQKLLQKEQQTNQIKYSNELFSRTDQIINLIYEKLADNFDKSIVEIIIDRGMNPVHFVLSKIVLEKDGFDKVKD
jgi:hypothetical protein